jgi:diacylglycerol kinase (ATP)
MQGMFWNYFSIGADAQAAYNFHHLRDQHPMLAPNRVANQFWYSAFSCSSGEPAVDQQLTAHA